MKCKICSHPTRVAFTAEILRRYQGRYLKCDHCGFLFAEDPVWLADAYKEAINISDTGIMQRNLYFSRLTAVVLYFFYDRTAPFLDHSGGYGIFTRLMRDIGFNYFWSDPYAANLLARGFELRSCRETKFEAVTCFEAFEHYQEPAEEIKAMLKMSDTIIFSTEILPVPLPAIDDWWYYGFDHGQHISFYRESSLNALAKVFSMNYYRFKGVHILTKKKLNTALLRLLSLIPAQIPYQYLCARMCSRTEEDQKYLIK
jgi:hypothetical protein